MSTKIGVERDLNRSVKLAFERLINPELLAQAILASYALDPQVEVDLSSDGAVIRLSRAYEEDWPSLVASFIGNRLEIEETRTWQRQADGNFKGHLELAAKGLPLTMTAVMELTDSGESLSRFVLNGSVKCTVPFIAGAVERLALDHIQSAIDLELDLLSS